MFRLILLYDVVAKLIRTLLQVVVISSKLLAKLLITILLSIATVITYLMMYSTTSVVTILNFIFIIFSKLVLLLFHIVFLVFKYLYFIPKSFFKNLYLVSIFFMSSIKSYIFFLFSQFVHFLRFCNYLCSNFSFVQFRRKYMTFKFFFKSIQFFVTRIILNATNIISFVLAKIIIVIQLTFANTIFLFVSNIFIFIFQIILNIYTFLLSGAYGLLIFVFNTLMFTQNMIVIALFMVKAILFLLISLFTRKFWKLFVDKGKKFVLETKRLSVYIATQFVKFSYKEIVIFIKVAQNIIISLIRVIWFYIRRMRLKLFIWFKHNILSVFMLVYMFLVLSFGSIYFLVANLNVYNKLSEESKKYSFVTRISEIIVLASQSDLLKPVHYNKVTFNVEAGESLYDTLRDNNVDPVNIVKISKYLKQYFDLRHLRSNWDLKMILVSSKNWEYNKIQNLYIPINNKEELVLDADINYNYIAYKRQKKLSRYIVRREFRIEDSIYQSANDAKVPNSITYLLFKIMSWDIDFQREIKPGDSVEIVYECLYNQNHELVTCDHLLFGHLKLAQRELVFYKYKNEYYHENGESVVKELLKTPLEYANQSRVSSPFGFRLHPVLGYTLLHTGVDFTGPVGSKIFASGDGVIVKKYLSTSYGNYIKIKHNDHLYSAYAHMKGFAKGTYVGKRVKQWEVIGYLGSTGRVTGPHLHYEIIINNKPSNPLTVKMPSNTSIKEEDRKDFNLYKTSLNTIVVRIPSKGMLLTSYTRDKNGNVIKDIPTKRLGESKKEVSANKNKAKADTKSKQTKSVGHKEISSNKNKAKVDTKSKQTKSAGDKEVSANKNKAKADTKSKQTKSAGDKEISANKNKAKADTKSKQTKSVGHKEISSNKNKAKVDTKSKQTKSAGDKEISSNKNKAKVDTKSKQTKSAGDKEVSANKNKAKADTKSKQTKSVGYKEVLSNDKVNL